MIHYTISLQNINLRLRLALIEFLIDWQTFDRGLSLAIDRLWADLAGGGRWLR
jgi:hypothetical protein